MQETKHLLLPALLWNRPSGHLYPVLAAKGRGYFLEGRHCYWPAELGGIQPGRNQITLICIPCDQSACADSQQAGKDARQLSSNPFLLALLEATEPQNWEKINKKSSKQVDHAKVEANPSFSKDGPQLVWWHIFQGFGFVCFVRMTVRHLHFTSSVIFNFYMHKGSVNQPE